MMDIKIYQVDAFTNRIFHGNPAAVCILPQEIDEKWAQDMAKEMNLSETAFLHYEGDGYRLRWFTPTTEVNLCGHATLASAHILWEQGFLGPEQTAVFKTKSGLLQATLDKDWIRLNFPTRPVQEVPPPAGLLDALGIEALFVGSFNRDYLLEVTSEAVVHNLKPDLNMLLSLPVRGVIVTSHSENSEYDFVSRFFAPASGIDEDPVTGSAHCCLGPYWKHKLNKNPLNAYQASARGGTLKVKVKGDRLDLFGQAITVFSGNLVKS